MAYRYRYYRKHYDGAGRTDASYARERNRVGQKFGGIDKEVLSALFQLTPERFSRLLSIYETQYGYSAANYARKTFTKWESGSTNMSGPILERFLTVAPPIFSFDTKVSLYRALRDRMRHREQINVVVSDVSDIALIEQHARRLIDRSYGISIPESVAARLSWLADGDGEIAKKIVLACELSEGEIISRQIQSELDDVLRLFADSAARPVASHVIELPNGTIHVTFRRKRTLFRRNKVSKENEDRTRESSGQELTPYRPNTGIIGYSLEGIPTDPGRAELMRAAQHEALRLEALQRQGQIESTFAAKEMGEFVEQAQEMDRRDVAFEMDADFKRASGKTHIRVENKRRRRFLFW